MNENAPQWLMALVASSMFIHGILAITLHRKLSMMDEALSSISARTKHAAESCSYGANRVGDCVVGIDRMNDSIESLVSDVNDNVFRLMWQEDANKARRHR